MKIDIDDLVEHLEEMLDDAYFEANKEISEEDVDELESYYSGKMTAYEDIIEFLRRYKNA